jgi:hypothetical protein
MASNHHWTRRRLACGTVIVAASFVVGCSSAPNQGDLGGQTSGDENEPVNVCSHPHSGCSCTTPNDTAACGEVVTQDGDYVTCSEGTITCQGGTWGPCIGTHNVFKSVGPLGGDIHTEGLGTSEGCANTPCDPYCMDFGGDGGDNAFGLDGGSGLKSTDAGGWTLVLHEGGACSGLQCSVPSCNNGQTTTLTGKVYDPAALNPVYNAVVMIPNGVLQPIPAGVSNAACAGAVLPAAVTYAYSAIDGTFTLTGVPVGASVPLIIQIGRWRRVININTSTLACGQSINLSASNCNGTNNYAGTANCITRLPRTQSEGNIPQIAIATGGLDAMECMLYRMGVSSSEFTDESHTGRVHVYNNGGAVLASPYANHDLSYLLGFTCPSSICPSTNITTGITNPSFETGTMSGWTAIGTNVTASNVEVSQGSWSALLGTTSSKGGTGTDSISQTFTAPAKAVALTFSYYTSCNNNKESFTATLVDNTKNTNSSTGAVCDSAAWYQGLFSGIVPGDSYTVTFTNADPDKKAMYTYVDDLEWQTSIQPTSLTNNYDLIMLPCNGGAEYNSTTWGGSNDDPGRQNLVNYANVGGRIFTSHWGREWIERTSTALPNGPFPGVASWYTDGATPYGGAADPDTGFFDTSFTRGQNLANWMKGVTGNGASLQVSPTRFDLLSVTAASKRFVYDWSDNNPNGHPNSPDSVFDFTFDTPLNSNNQVGRAMFTDMHLANGTPSGTFPSNCPTQGSALLTQEDAAEYLLFDLGACVSGSPLPAPAYQPATFTRDFQGTCAAGNRVVWHYFYWKDATPSDTNITFTALTADTQAQLGSQFSAVSLATASGADSCPNGPSCASTFVGVNVDPKLVAAGQQSHSWLRVSMTLNPSSDKATTPTLYAWQQTYDCIASE